MLGETREDHEWRLMAFFLYVIRSEAQRLRRDLLTTQRLQGTLEAHAHAQRLRDALMAMLVLPIDETPGGAMALQLRLRRALLVILPREAESSQCFDAWCGHPRAL